MPVIEQSSDGFVTPPQSRAKRVGTAILFLLLGLSACDRERREARGRPLPESVPVQPATIFAAGPGDALMPLDPRAEAYEENAYHIGQGQLLYSQFNCVGCHAHGGGSMGPALMDAEWIYGGRADQIVATIAEGRPNGMPSWRGKMTEQQMWQLAAYVRSLSGQVPKDAPPSRADTISNVEPLTLKEEEPVNAASSELAQ
jgi:cytochrome c oxidase cbb3-type subunit III